MVENQTFFRNLLFSVRNWCHGKFVNHPSYPNNHPVSNTKQVSSVPQHYIRWFQPLTNHSHTPPNWSAAGGWTSVWFPVELEGLPSLVCSVPQYVLPIHFPLQQKITRGSPLRAINCLIAIRQLSLSNLDTNPKRAALIVRHLDRQNHPTPFRFSILVVTGPNSIVTGLCTLFFCR